MPNPDKIKAELLRLLAARDQGAKLNRIEDWLVVRSREDAASALRSFRGESRRQTRKMMARVIQFPG